MPAAQMRRLERPETDIVAMRRVLAAMREPSPSEALRALREAFPHLPLEKRVEALKTRR